MDVEKEVNMISPPEKISKNKKSPSSNLVTKNTVWDGEKLFITASLVHH